MPSMKPARSVIKARTSSLSVAISPLDDNIDGGASCTSACVTIVCVAAVDVSGVVSMCRVLAAVGDEGVDEKRVQRSCSEST